LLLDQIDFGDLYLAEILKLQKRGGLELVLMWVKI